jgi:KUP system potassium uptake protein
VPSVLQALGRVKQDGRPVSVKVMDTSFYLGRETLIATRAGAKSSAAADGTGFGRMSLWRKKLFILMTRNARSATAFFGLPPNRVVELGAQIQF